MKLKLVGKKVAAQGAPITLYGLDGVFTKVQFGVEVADSPMPIPMPCGVATRE